MKEQQKHLERVSAKIAPVILEFCSWLLERGLTTFHMEHLRKFVIKRVPEIAPDSPSRILRDLRLRGRLDYKIVSRKDSLYEILSVKSED